MNNQELYTHAMTKALQLAEHGRYKTAPNPCVGAVLIKDDVIVAGGYHTIYGADHAEVSCIKNAKTKGIDTKGATLVVTLEPCNHHGKTPPCTEAILEAGIAKVIIGMHDVNPKASGGAEYLQSQGVEVVVGVLEEKCQALLEDFKIWVKHQRPYTILKMGTTLDGKIATQEGKSKYITGADSREEVANLRAHFGLANGIILIGGETFLKDNPKLTAREVDCTKQPRAAVISTTITHSQTSYLLKERASETIFFTTHAQAASPNAAKLRTCGVTIYGVDSGKNSNKLDLKKIFSILYTEEKCPYILCEGGATLAFALLESNLVDEYRQYIAPLVFADKNAKNVFEGNELDEISSAFKLKLKSSRVLGDDIELIYTPLQTV